MSKAVTLHLSSTFALILAACSSDVESSKVDTTPPDKTAASDTIAAGQQVFRFETFGDEAFWGDTLKLHTAIEDDQHGGVGSGLTPRAAQLLLDGKTARPDGRPAATLIPNAFGLAGTNLHTWTAGEDRPRRVPQVPVSGVACRPNTAPHGLTSSWPHGLQSR
jgi:hypothetical protein